MTLHRYAFILSGALAIQAAFSTALPAAEKPAAATAPNAAVVYWQAFALLPEPLAEPEETKYEAAVANPAAPVTDDLRPIVAKFNNSLGQLHRAARIAACDWNPDYWPRAAQLGRYICGKCVHDRHNPDPYRTDGPADS